MMRKLTFLAGFAAGYVVGARAGRDSYDRIADKAQQAWKDPRVQEKVGQVQEVAKDKAEQAQEAVMEKASGLAEDVKDRASSDGGAAGGSGETAGSASSADAEGAGVTPTLPSSTDPDAPSEAPTGRVTGYSGGPMS
ncbi:hypothetical protein [Nocardioides massiliensis]|uniref:Gas vesicle protein n=1 Tax=Nocardioides massiliensis TaxID=1325935 RepID=A0ABT9NTI9_9ACTN|nr:hypothetical protein [Nocardioides massiliensis]MDP9823737.1 gas vesicle protein [Nocardioides massiliensis]